MDYVGFSLSSDQQDFLCSALTTSQLVSCSRESSGHLRERTGTLSEVKLSCHGIIFSVSHRRQKNHYMASSRSSVCQAKH